MRRIAVGVGLGFAVALLAILLLVVTPGIEFGPTNPESGPYLTFEPAGEATERGDAAVEFEALSPDQRNVFEDALAENGSIQHPDDVDADVWYRHDYVRYQGTDYRILVAEN